MVSMRSLVFLCCVGLGASHLGENVAATDGSLLSSRTVAGLESLKGSSSKALLHGSGAAPTPGIEADVVDWAKNDYMSKEEQGDDKLISEEMDGSMELIDNMIIKTIRGENRKKSYGELFEKSMTSVSSMISATAESSGPAKPWLLAAGLVVQGLGFVASTNAEETPKPLTLKDVQEQVTGMFSDLQGNIDQHFEKTLARFDRLENAMVAIADRLNEEMALTGAVLLKPEDIFFAQVDRVHDKLAKVIFSREKVADKMLCREAPSLLFEMMKFFNDQAGWQENLKFVEREHGAAAAALRFSQIVSARFDSMFVALLYYSSASCASVNGLMDMNSVNDEVERFHKDINMMMAKQNPLDLERNPRGSSIAFRKMLNASFTQLQGCTKHTGRGHGCPCKEIEGGGSAHPECMSNRCAPDWNTCEADECAAWTEALDIHEQLQSENWWVSGMTIDKTVWPDRPIGPCCMTACMNAAFANYVHKHEEAQGAQQEWKEFQGTADYKTGKATPDWMKKFTPDMFTPDMKPHLAAEKFARQWVKPLKNGYVDQDFLESHIIKSAAYGSFTTDNVPELLQEKFPEVLEKCRTYVCH